jgi:hypothetical protein
MSEVIKIYDLLTVTFDNYIIFENITLNITLKIPAFYTSIPANSFLSLYMWNTGRLSTLIYISHWILIGKFSSSSKNTLVSELLEFNQYNQYNRHMTTN